MASLQESTDSDVHSISVPNENLDFSSDYDDAFKGTEEEKKKERGRSEKEDRGTTSKRRTS